VTRPRAGELTFPQGVCLADGELFVCDCEDHRVVVYDALTMKYKRHFGSYGEEEGDLSFPYSCAVVGKEVIVADVANHRLSCFSKTSGKFIRTIGGEGDAPGRFSSPRAIAVLRRPLPAQKLAAADGGAAAEHGVGIVVDGTPTQLERDALLVVCEQKRLQVCMRSSAAAARARDSAAPPRACPSPQVLTLAGEPLQLVSMESPGTKTDLWSVCAAGRFMYVTDRGASCVHVLSSPRMGAGADAAKSRYMTMTPRKSARAAAMADVCNLVNDALTSEALEAQASPSASPRLEEPRTIGSVGTPRMEDSPQPGDGQLTARGGRGVRMASTQKRPKEEADEANVARRPIPSPSPSLGRSESSFRVEVPTPGPATPGSRLQLQADRMLRAQQDRMAKIQEKAARNVAAAAQVPPIDVAGAQAEAGVAPSPAKDWDEYDPAIRV
jgi:hypothetical protein